MKYHKHIIKVVISDLGEDTEQGNKVYEVWKDGEYIEVCWTMDNAKEFIDSGYDRNLLG